MDSEANTSQVSDAQEDSVLKILTEKHDAIKKSVSLLRKHIANQVEGPASGTEAVSGSEESEYGGLIDLLGDTNVNSIIRSVAGNETQELINEAIKAVNLGADKSAVLTQSIESLKTSLSPPDRSGVINDSRVKLALGLIGVDKKYFNKKS